MSSEGAEKRSLPARVWLAALAFVCALPIVLLSIGLLGFQIERHREGVLSQVAETARALRLTVDREIAVRTTTLLALSGSASLAMNDLERFRRTAAAAAAHTGPQNEIMLADASGAAVLSTHKPFGTALPPISPLTGFTRVFETRKPYVSDIFNDPATLSPMYAISVPVEIDGTVKYALVKRLNPDAMTRILQEQNLPKGWVAGVFDRNVVVAGRNVGADRFVGKTGSPQLVEALKGAPEGSIESRTLEGISVISSWNRSPVTGWGVAVAVPTTYFSQIWQSDLLFFGLPALFVLLLSMLLAWLAGGGIASTMAAVAQSAQALASGKTPPRVASRIGEINDIQEALAQTSAMMAESREVRAEQMADLRAADERQRLLIGELDHRAKNMLAAVQSIARRSLPGGEASERLEGRLIALARAHSELAATSWRGASLLKLLEAETAPFEGFVTLDGPDLLLNPKTAQAMALIMHELATNAAKHGALSAKGGRVRIAWDIDRRAEPKLQLTWTESGGPAVAPPTRVGFGRTLIERSAKLELNGDVALTFAPKGVRCTLTIPMGEVMMTPWPKSDAKPSPAAPSLAPPPPKPAANARKRILVVEDEALVALDICDALERSGYDVEGPASRLEAALELARSAPLDAAVLDANLAGEPAFPVADELARRGVPFLFASGYSDLKNFPAAHQSVTRIEKPFDRTQLVQAVGRLLSEA